MHNEIEYYSDKEDLEDWISDGINTISEVGGILLNINVQRINSETSDDYRIIFQYWS